MNEVNVTSPSEHSECLEPVVMLRPMEEAPRDGTEILAYHLEGKTLHPVRQALGGAWSMRWNSNYRQYDNQFLGWVPVPNIAT